MNAMKALAVLVAAGLATGIFLTASGRLHSNAVDRWCMRMVLEKRSAAYDHAMLKLTEIWSNENYIRAAVPIAAYGDDRAYAWLEACTKAMLLSEAIVSPLKYMVGRRRPDGTLDRKNASFPSSHASSAFAFAVTLARYYPEQGPAILETACFVAISRVYLERHYPTDILAGAAIGVTAAAISELYLSWLHFDRERFLAILLLLAGPGALQPIETPLFN
jgi:membrane-associated phospholipid phosphatase